MDQFVELAANWRRNVDNVFVPDLVRQAVYVCADDLEVAASRAAGFVELSDPDYPGLCTVCHGAEPFPHLTGPAGSEPVYFAQSEANLMVKVGKGKSPRSRFSSLQTGSPVPLRLVAHTHCGGFDLERTIHEHFKDSRRSGEWFDLSRDMVRAIHTVRRRYKEINDYLAPVLVPGSWIEQAA